MTLGKSDIERGITTTRPFNFAIKNRLSVCLLFVLTVFLCANQAHAQTCPVSSTSVSFDWSTSAGTGNEWLSSNQNTGDFQVYTINYTDGGGNPATVDVTVTLQDPDGVNFDDNFVCDPAIGPSPCDNEPPSASTTQTNGIYGTGFLTIAEGTVSSSQSMGLDFSFSKPTYMDNFVVGDIDYVGYGNVPNDEPGDSFQDTVTLTASNGGVNVPTTAVAGSNLTVSGGTYQSIYNVGVNGNLTPDNPAGTVTVSTSSPIDALSFVYSNGSADAAAEPTSSGISDGHAVRISGFDFCVQDPPPELVITKTSSANGGPVSPGETITYTIEVENIGLGGATDVVVTDTLPTGVTYVASSAQKTYQAGGSGSFSHDMGSGTFDTGGLTQSYTVTSADVPAGATLTSYGFTTTGTSFNRRRHISLIATYPGGTAYSLPTTSFGDTAGDWNVSRGPDAFGGSALGTYTFVWDDARDGVAGDDNSISTAEFTITYSTPRVPVTDAAAAPPNLVTAAEGIDLLAGEIMTITFDVIVDDPLDSAITQLTNTAATTSSELPTPVTDTAIDAVLQPGTITGNVSQDTDLNGSGDTDLSAVTVELIQRFDVINSSIDINGDGVIDGADDGFFDGVEIINGRPDINGDGVTDGADDGTLAGITVINGRMDINGDGSVSATNRPLDDGTAQALIDTQLTDASGNYSFDDVVPGDYIVVETNPAGLNDVSDQDDSNDGDPADSDTTVDNEIGVTLLAGETDADNNFVDAAPPGSIGDTIFEDVNGNGVFDAGEGIAGVDVTLTGTDINGNPVSLTTTTDANGNYLFDNLPASDVTGYTVTVDESDLAASLQGNNTVDPDGGSDSTSTIVLAAGEDNLLQDFGYQAPLGSIGDTVFEDANGNGVFDAGEGIAGVDVTLTGTDIDGNPVSLTATTDANGNYLFANLPASDAIGYTVTVDETDLSASLQGNNTVDPNGGGDSTSTVVLAAGENNLAQDFGYQAPLGSIGDTVFEDANGNGVFDAGEGIAGVDVTLTGTDIDGNPVSLTATTDANGNYLFANLPASDATGYTVTVDETDLPASLQGNNTVDPDGGGDSTSTIVLAAGEDNLAQDFGYEAPAGSIGDTVFDDANGNGVFDAGEGIAGVDVTLTGTDIDGNPVSLTTTTDGSGNYLFDNLLASDATGYTVTVDETDLATSLQGNNTVDPDGGNDSTSTVVLAGGEDNLVQDFGYQAPPGSIGDTVFDDANGNGVFDAGEGIAGVDVTLTGTDIDGNPVSLTTTTDASGNYLFDNLPASDATGYTVTVDETDLPVSLQGNNTVDPDGGGDSTSTVVLAVGEDNLAQDFGYEAPPGSVGDTVFLDLDNDGVPDAGEGIANATVTLVGTDIDGNPVSLTTTTDANGNYLFDNLIASDAGGYTISVDISSFPVNLQNAFNSVDPDAGGDSTSTVVLAAGEDNLLQDFGYLPGVKFQKTTVPSDLTTTFNFTATGSLSGALSLTGLPLGNGDMSGFTAFVPGESMTVTETDSDNNGTLQNFDIVYDCRDNLGVVVFSGSTIDGSVTLINNNKDAQFVINPMPANDLTCIVTNIRQARITIVKQAFPADATDFPFTVTSVGGNTGITDFTLDGETVDSGDVDAFINQIDFNVSNPDSDIYTVTEQPPSGWELTDIVCSVIDGDLNDGNPGSIDPVINLAAGSVELDVDNGDEVVCTYTNRQLGSIGDTLWNDINGDGVEDAGEPGIAGVTVELQDGVCTPGVDCPTTVTSDGTTDVDGDSIIDPAGSYYFGDLQPGTYTVQVDTSTLPASFDNGSLNTGDPQNDGNSTSTISLAVGENNVDQDFGYQAPLGSIGDTVFDDANGNGVFDAGEGLVGVDVTLTGTDIDGNPVNVTVTTDANGNYLFDNLPASDASGYTVTVDETDLAVSLQGNNTVDPDGGNDSTSNVVLAAGEDNLLQDFGYEASLGSVGDTVFDDANGNGVFDAGEGIAGVDVTLTGTDIDGNPVNVTVTTDANGNYLFDNLPASDASGYTVTVDETDLPVSLQGNNTVDPDGGGDSTSTVVLAAGEDNLDQDFGYEASLGSIGDTVFDDANGNGVFDAGEGLAGVDVTLTGTDIDGNPVSLTTTTDASGNYLFDNLPASDATGYTVTVDETDLAVSLQGNNTVDPDGGSDSTSTVVLAAGEDNLDQDFGYQVPLGSIGDTVFDDANGNGVFDAGEGLVGVDVTLTGTDIDGNPVNVTVTTDANGNYLFGNLPASDASGYTVTVDETDLPVSLQGNNTVDPDGGGDSTSTVVLAAGEDNLAQDFGYEAPLGSIGDTVFDDANGNGVFDAGEGIAGVDVTLTGTDIDGNPVNVTVTTAGDGQYVFSNLPASDATGYAVTVDETDLAASLQGNNTVDPDGGNDSTSNVVLAAGEDNLLQDFGYEAPLGSIGDTVFIDLNNDGVADAGEGLGGITVSLSGTDINGNPVSLTTTTDANGNYLFDNLLASDASGYTVTVDETDLPVSLQGNNTVDPDGGGDSTSTVVLAAGEDNLVQDFGYVAPLGSIGDTVFDDANGNGVFDAGEGIAGVDVTLTGTDINGDPVSLTATTDANGNYLFDNLLASDTSGYAVTVDETDLPVSLQGNNTVDPDGGGDSTSNVVLAAGEDNLDQDFGYEAPLGSIGDTVFDDTNGNGVFDAGEGIAGVDVTLTGTDIDGNPVNVTVTTDANGNYLFDNLPASDASGYTVTVDETDLPVSLQGNNTVDPDGGGDSTSNVVLAAGEDNLLQDFGYQVPLGSIGDFVWHDTDGDGIQDVDEEGIVGVTVTLTPPAGVDLGAGSGVAITTTTDVNGNYLFTNLPEGSGYTIDFDSPTGYVFSPQDQGGDDTLDSDVDSSGAAAAFDVVAGVDNLTLDAGLVPGGSIGDHIWLDTDGDGVDDISEQGIAGVTVELTGTAADGTAVNLTTVTDANGDYLFDNLPPGNYTVTVTDTNGELTDLVQSPGNTGSEAVTLAAGENYLDADFGYVPAAGTAVIGDTVWADVDGDGIQDPGEVGLAGVTLDLVDSSGNVVATTTTDASGNYLFTNVAPGDYTVLVTDTSGVITDPATNVTSGPQSPGSLTSDPITVLADDVYVDADFGFTAQTGSTLADRIWYDADGDGVQDAGESGIGGVTIDLLDSNGVIIASVVTDADGNFAFTGLPDGDYSIVITDDNDVLAGYFPTTPPADALQQSITALAGDIVNQDSTAPNPVTSGSGDGHPSFGFNQPSTIGDTIWNDANGDGVQDLGEGGLAGVTVTLTNSFGTVIGTAVTDASGNYLFANIPVGTNYTVTVDANNFSSGGALEGYTQTYDADDGTAAADNSSVLSLADGESNLVQDFGYQNTALPSVSGTVFYDVDTDGGHEPDGNDMTPGNADDETGIVGVSIDLVDSSGNVVATTTTDANGDYSFPDVPPADYTVEVTDTNSVLDGYELTSGLDVLSVTQTQLTAGDVTDVDFGYVDDEQTASITSGLWIDSDGDGVRDPDETPIPNVDINLIDCGADALCGTADDTIVGTASTDIDGNVIFPDLPPGLYSLDSIETDPDFPSDITQISNYSPDFNDPAAPIQLSEGETYDADFGYSPAPGTAGLSGTLWNDSQADGSDGDGIRDASEVGLGGIPVQLIDVATGNPVATTTTAADGSYEFTGLTPCPGADPCYQIVYDESSVTALGLDGVEPTNTQDLGGSVSPTTPDGVNDNNYLVYLADGDFKEDHNFGFDAPANTFGALEGTVYFEPAPADGTLTPGIDTGIESVTVNLLDSNGDVVATTTTSDGFTDVDGDGVIDPAGYYSFTNLVPGDYTVGVTDLNNSTIGLNPSGDPDEAGVCTVCDEQSDPVTVSAGPAPAPVNFGYMGEQSLGNIGNLIWYDVGGPSLSDGLFDPLQGDKGIAGVTVECWFDADGDKLLTIAGKDNLLRTVTTDENGEYYCEGLPTGGYLVRVTDDAGRLTGAIAANLPAGGSVGTDGIAGTLDDLDEANKMAIPLASIPTSGLSPAWYIQTGSDNLTADFAITGTNNLSGTVFEEEAGSTANGLLDGADTGTPGVTVILLVEQPDGTFVEFTRITTDANGDYEFIGLPNGNYQVVVDTDGSSINGYGQTGDPDISTSFCTSALAPLCDDKAGSVVPIALTGGSNVTDVDFGYQTEFVTSPITLGYFHAKSIGGDAVEINWQTVTEVAHLGFNLYVREKAQGQKSNGWRRLNAELIAPAAPGDSFDTREYTFTTYGVAGKRFALGDVDVTGNETIHGPFKLDRKAGANRAARAATDWDAIQAKRQASKQATQAKRKARAEKRLQKKLKKVKAKAAREARKLNRSQRVESNKGNAKALKSMNQTGDQQDSQEDKEFEMLELDNEQCELEGCYNLERSGDELGQTEPTGSKSPSFASRLVAGLFALMIPNAHALEPAVEIGVIEIETTEAGIYKVTYDDLLAQGIDIRDVFHWRLSLTNDNELVYIRSWGQHASNGDRRYFGPGGGFEFVARESRTLYSKSNVYTLHVSVKGYRKTIRPDTAVLPATGTVVDYYQETTALEPEIAYSTLSPNGDPWFGFQALSSGADKTITIPYRVDNFAAGKGVVETELKAWGMTTGSHAVSISANGQAIDSQQFSGISNVTLSGELAASSLVDGVNTYSLTIPGRGVMDQLALDKWQVTYPRWTIANDAKALEFEAAGEIISVSDLKSKWVRIIREDASGVMTWIPYGKMKRMREADKSYTIRFAGTAQAAKYYVSVITNADRRIANLTLPALQDDLMTGSASYLIVSHPDFIDANMDRFIAAKRAQGFSVKVADVDAVYTTFGAGKFGAAAIQDYIRWAHTHLGTQMVLLVGDDMYDYHGNQYPNAISFIPSLYDSTSALVNLAPVDAKYVDFNDDDIPDLPIGRLNPKLVGEWAAMVDKTLSYAGHPNPQSIVFSADGFDAAQGYDFTADAQEMLSRLPASWQAGASTYYIDELGSAGARSGLLSALNNGSAVTAFVGHSGPRDWSFSGLLSASDASNMTNNGAPTVVTQWGCWNTYYATPNGSMANEFLRNPNGGAVAVLGAVALSEAVHEKALALELYDRLFVAGMSIGQAVLEAKQAYASVNPVSTHKDVILGWTLMADPALVIQP